MKLDEDALEAVARALCSIRGVSPSTLFQAMPGGPAFPEDGHFINSRGERCAMYLAWRKFVPAAEAAILAYEAHKAASAGTGDWLPIESAPKDGTVILGWSENEMFPAPMCWGIPQDDDGSHKGSPSAWNYADYALAASAGEVSPTHWRPLPSPPAGRTEPT